MSGQDEGEFHCIYAPPLRQVFVEEYVYEIGSYHYNWHRELEILLVLTGEIEVCVGGNVRAARPGDIVVINSNEGHATLPLVPGSHVLLLHIGPDYLSSFTENTTVPAFHCQTVSANRHREPYPSLRRMLAASMLLSGSTQPADLASFESYISQIVAILFRDFLAVSDYDASGQTEIDKSIARVTEYIDAHYRERVSLKTLTKVGGYSTTYLSELFSSQLGMTSSEYLTRVRLAHAVRQLGETDRKIAQIATDNGFPDVKALGVAFKRAFKRTPSQYRSQLRELDRAGANLGQVDEFFHKTFTRRANENIHAILSQMACVDSHPAPASNQELERQLAELAKATEIISARIGELGGSQLRK